jgi:hypothetical protein
MSASNASPKKRRDWKPTFLSSMLESGTVTEACRAAGIDRSTAYRARQQDETFAIAWADVEERSTEELETVAMRRAIDGSDTLMIFLLKARRPEKYRENVKIEHAGSVQQDLSGLSMEELRERARAILNG